MFEKCLEHANKYFEGIPITNKEFFQRSHKKNLTKYTKYKRLTADDFYILTENAIVLIVQLLAEAVIRQIDTDINQDKSRLIVCSKLNADIIEYPDTFEVTYLVLCRVAILPTE